VRSAREAHCEAEQLPIWRLLFRKRGAAAVPRARGK